MAKKPTAAATEKPKNGVITHNSGSGIDPKREAVFIREFQNIKDNEAEMAGTKGVMAGVYKRLESAGFSKDHITFAKSLEKRNVAEVIADFEMKIAICRIMGHAAGRQLDMLADRTPMEDAAFIDGVAAGKLGRAASNPYGMETAAGQNWQKGFNEGNAFRNMALNEAVNGDQNIIKAGESSDAGNGSGGGSDTAGADQGDNTSVTGDEGTGAGSSVQEQQEAQTESAGEIDGDDDDEFASADEEETGDADADADAPVADDEDDWEAAAPKK